MPGIELQENSKESSEKSNIFCTHIQGENNIMNAQKRKKKSEKGESDEKVESATYTNALLTISKHF